MNDITNDDIVQCQIEGCNHKGKTLRDHVVRIHNMTTIEYKNKFGKHSLVSKSYLTKLQKSGNEATKTVDDRVYRHKCRNDNCENIINGKALICDDCKAKQQENLLEQQKLKFKDLIEGKDFVKCKICGWLDVRISGHIKSIHNMDKKQYRNVYPNSQLICNDVKNKTAFRGSHSVESRRQMAISHIKRLGG